MNSSIDQAPAIDERVLWINTGGTIVSKRYEDLKNPPDSIDPLSLEDAEVYVRAAMKKLEVADRVDSLTLVPKKWDYDLKRFNKDSSKIYEEANDTIPALAQIIKKSDHRVVLITHGTNWMVFNAANLQRELNAIGVTDKVVLFTGAMVPLSMADDEHPSDAPGNLKYIFDHMGDITTPGVYVVGRDAHTKQMGHFDPFKTMKDWTLSMTDLQLTFTKATSGIDRWNSAVLGIKNVRS